MTAVFDAIGGDLETVAFLAGLAVVCGVIATIKFSNRASGAVLNKLGRG